MAHPGQKLCCVCYLTFGSHVIVENLQNQKARALGSLILIVFISGRFWLGDGTVTVIDGDASCGEAIVLCSSFFTSVNLLKGVPIGVVRDAKSDTHL